MKWRGGAYIYEATASQPAAVQSTGSDCAVGSVGSRYGETIRPLPSTQPRASTFYCRSPFILYWCSSKQRTHRAHQTCIYASVIPIKLTRNGKAVTISLLSFGLWDLTWTVVRCSLAKFDVAVIIISVQILNRNMLLIAFKFIDMLKLN